MCLQGHPCVCPSGVASVCEDAAQVLSHVQGSWLDGMLAHTSDKGHQAGYKKTCMSLPPGGEAHVTRADLQIISLLCPEDLQVYGGETSKCKKTCMWGTDLCPGTMGAGKGSTQESGAGSGVLSSLDRSIWPRQPVYACRKV